MDEDWTDTSLTPAGQAIYLSDLPTGSLVTPYDRRAKRSERQQWKNTTRHS